MHVGDVEVARLALRRRRRSFRRPRRAAPRRGTPPCSRRRSAAARSRPDRRPWHPRSRRSIYLLRRRTGPGRGRRRRLAGQDGLAAGGAGWVGRIGAAGDPLGGRFRARRDAPPQRLGVVGAAAIRPASIGACWSTSSPIQATVEPSALIEAPGGESLRIPVGGGRPEAEPAAEEDGAQSFAFFVPGSAGATPFQYLRLTSLVSSLSR